MTKIKIPDKMSRTINKGLLALKKRSPELLVISGTVGLVVSGVLACRATTKVDEILDTAKTRIDSVHDTAKKIESGEKEGTYTEQEQKKDISIIYAQTGLKFVKLYSLPATLATVSIVCILSGHNILRKRNTALAAAYMAEHKAFDDYRNGVIEKFGKELDKELKYGLKTQEIETKVTNPDGSETTVKETVQVGNPNEHSPYTKCFDETNPNWVRNAEENLFFIKQTQDYLNDLLRRRGHVFLNEVYDRLGFERTKAGQSVGWVYDRGPDSKFDGYIDFGIFDLYDANKRNFVNGYERSIWLDFNVDGPICECLP